MWYKPNVQAQQLRAGIARTVCIIIPRINMKNYNDLYVGLEHCLREQDFTVELFCTDNLENNEEQAVKKALSFNPAAIVIVSSFLRNKGLFHSDTKIFFVERKVKGIPEDSVYAGFFYGKAGRDIAKICVEKRHRAVAILCENSDFSNVKDFIAQASDVFDEENCLYRIFPSDDHMWLNKAFDILGAKEEFDAVIAMSREDATYLRSAGEYNCHKKMPAIYTMTGKSMELDGDARWYQLNYKLLGRMIGERIAGVSENTGNIILENDGFNFEKPSAVSNREQIRFLTIQNPTSKAVQMLLPSFAKETGIQVSMIEMPYDEHYKMTQMCEKSDTYDLIRIDMVWLAELGDKIYQKLDETDQDVDWLKNQHPLTQKLWGLYIPWC